MNNSSQILREMQSLQKTWRQQNFMFTKEQSSRYQELSMLRHAFISYWKEQGLVWSGPSNVGKAKTESAA